MYIDLSDAEVIYLQEAVMRLHNENLDALGAMYSSAEENGLYSREDVVRLMEKEADLYKGLMERLSRRN